MTKFIFSNHQLKSARSDWRLTDYSLGPFSAWIHLIGYFTFQALVFWEYPLFQGFGCWRAPGINSFREKFSTCRESTGKFSSLSYRASFIISCSTPNALSTFLQTCIKTNPGIVFYITLRLKRTTLFLSQVFSNCLCKVKSLKTKGCKSFVLANTWL